MTKRKQEPLEFNAKKVKQDIDESTTNDTFGPAYNQDSNANRSILVATRSEKNNVQVAKLLFNLLELDNEELYRKGCVNLVLGYFNNYLNGLPENIGQDRNNGVEDDGQKIWHAQVIDRNVLKVTKRNQQTKFIENTRAIKLLPNSTMGLSEAINTSKLNHPNVLKIYNVLLIRNICCIEMEYIQCGSLHDLINNHISYEHITNMLYQCCEVLSLTKQNQMVYDIKSNNIMIRNHQDYSLAIGDFELTLNETSDETYCTQLTFHNNIYSLGKIFREFGFQGVADFCSENLFTRETTFYDFVYNEYCKNKLNTHIWDNDEQHVLFCIRKSNEFTLGERLRRNKRFIMDNTLYKYADLKDILLWQDREFVLGAVKNNGNVLEYANESFKKDLEIALEAVKQNFGALEYIDESLRKVREIVFESVKQDGSLLLCEDNPFKNDREFVLVAVKQNGAVLEHVEKLFKKDREIVLEAVKNNGNAVQYVHQSLKKDREIALESVKNGGTICYVDESLRIKKYGGALEYAHESFKKDREMVLEAVKNSRFFFQHVDESFKKDREIVLEAVKQYGGSLEYADELLKKDREIVLIAVKQYGYALQHADDSLKKDREIVLEAIKQNGGTGYPIISFADESLLKDREFMLEACKLADYTLEYADISLGKDREFILTAVKIWGGAIQFADEKLRKDREIVLEAVKQFGRAFEYADDSLKNDREILFEAIKYDANYFNYADESLRNDREFVLEAINQNDDVLEYVEDY